MDIAAITGLTIFGVAVTRWLGKHPFGEKRCTGYPSRNAISGTVMTMHDCHALRNPVCSDGRCTVHCRELCKCNPL